MGSRGIAVALAAGGFLAIAALLLGAGPASAAPSYPDAVVMVSGYNSATSFTTPDPSCEGQEGDTWSNPAGPAAALRADGEDVFTAPVQHGSDPLGAPCAPGGAPVPPASDSIDSFGDNDANGAALASFLAFLRDEYGVEKVQLVAHSDGGQWSRSAMTQDAAFSGLDVRSLTTLGTPYTGSMVADLATELKNGRCDFSDPAEQDLCEALFDVIRQVYSGMGPTTIEQLTHTYLEPWNREQTIGACPVTTIAGTGLDLDLVPFSYYNPSDGLVGEASGLARSAFELPDLEMIPAPGIPNLEFGGTYPVVHAPSLKFISAENLLNTPAISAKVAGTVAGTPPDGALCNAEAPAPDAAKAGAEDRWSVPFRLTRSVVSSGRLGATASDDVAVVRRGTTLRCDGRVVPQVPLLTKRRVGLALPGACEGPLRAVGGSGSEGGALLFRSHPTADLDVIRDGRELTVRGPGAGRGALKLTLRRDGKTKRLRLRHGKVRLPAGPGSATLIAKARTQPGGRRAVATLVLALRDR